MVSGIEVTLAKGVKPYLLVTPGNNLDQPVSFVYRSKAAIIPPLWTPGQQYNVGDLVYYSPPSVTTTSKAEIDNDRFFICNGAGVAVSGENPIDLARGVVAPTGAGFARHACQFLPTFTSSNQFTVFDPYLVAKGIKYKWLAENSADYVAAEIEFRTALKLAVGKLNNPDPTILGCPSTFSPEYHITEVL
jgi:hypothetical protein